MDIDKPDVGGPGCCTGIILSMIAEHQSADPIDEDLVVKKQGGSNQSGLMKTQSFDDD